jgi:hypothetical protein
VTGTRLAIAALVACGASPRPVAISEHDPDFDRDGIVELDLCPTRPEDLDGDEDADGCPEVDCDHCCSYVERRAIAFYPKDITVAPVVHRNLVAIANELRARRALVVELVGIAVREPAQLGVLRANAVRVYLIKLGIAAARLRVAEDQRPGRSGLEDRVELELLESDCVEIDDVDDVE